MLLLAMQFILRLLTYYFILTRKLVHYDKQTNNTLISVLAFFWYEFSENDKILFHYFLESKRLAQVQYRSMPFMEVATNCMTQNVKWFTVRRCDQYIINVYNGIIYFFESNNLIAWKSGDLASDPMVLIFSELFCDFGRMNNPI